MSSTMSLDDTSLRAKRSNPMDFAMHFGLLRRYAPRNDVLSSSERNEEPPDKYEEILQATALSG